MSRFVVKDLKGKIFSKLTVLKYSGPNKNNRSLWLCKCECGNELLILGSKLTTGRVKSCGCYVKHGMSKTRLHNIWENIKSRCLNKNNTRYSTYGGRDIRVCPIWINNFSAFRDWAFNNGYTDQLSIERKNVNGNYEPDNCKWIPMVEQALNKTNTIKIEIDGIVYSAKQIAEKYNLQVKTVRSRVKKGYDISKITAPIEERYKRQGYYWP